MATKTQVVVYNGELLIPLKCGTRFMDSFGLENKSVCISDIKGRELFSPNKIKWIVIREPYEHLKSGIYTEILNDIEFKNADSDSINEIIHKAINSELTHWGKTMYKDLYYIFVKNIKRIEIVNIQELSHLSKRLYGIEKEYNPKNYDFNHYKNWISKEDMWKKLQTEYPMECSILESFALEDTKWYNLLLNRDNSMLKML